MSSRVVVTAVGGSVRGRARIERRPGRVRQARRERLRSAFLVAVPPVAVGLAVLVRRAGPRGDRPDADRYADRRTRRDAAIAPRAVGADRTGREHVRETGRDGLIRCVAGGSWPARVGGRHGGVGRTLGDAADAGGCGGRWAGWGGHWRMWRTLGGMGQMLSGAGQTRVGYCRRDAGCCRREAGRDGTVWGRRGARKSPTSGRESEQFRRARANVYCAKSSHEPSGSFRDVRDKRSRPAGA